MKWIKTLIMCTTFIIFSSMQIFAQCAMCRAGVESSISDGRLLNSGLNAGILYLAALPYLIFAIIAYLWYQQSKKNKYAKHQHLSGNISK
jgi:hypothetical protein